MLRSVNIEIERGEDISIVGQSGSGKSTLLQMLGALDSAQGELHLADRKGVMQNVFQLPPQKIDRFEINVWFYLSVSSPVTRPRCP